MTKEKLKQYGDLKRETEKLEKRIKKIEKQSSMVSDVVQNGYKRHAVIYGYDCKRAYKLNMLKEKLEELRENSITEQIEIANWIKSIQESDVRQIFMHRYIEEMNWLQIMHAMKYNSESAARMKHDRFLEENL